MAEGPVVVTISRDEVLETDLVLKAKQWLNVLSCMAMMAEKIAAVESDIKHLQRVVLDQGEILHDQGERLTALEQRGNRQKPWHAEPIVTRVNLS